MAQQSAFVDAEIKRITGLKQKSAKLIHYRATQRHLLTLERRRRTEKWLGFWMSILTTVVCFIVGNVFALKKKHPYAFAWYDGRKISGAQKGVGRDGRTEAYGYRRGPKPLGGTAYGMLCCAIAEEYPALLSPLSLASACPTINRAGSIFLLTFCQRYFNEIEGVHWSGSAPQLNYSKAQTYVRSWADWNVDDNKWAWLYPQESVFDLSSAVKSAQLTWSDSYLESLFSGGLCQLVHDHTSDTSDPDTMMQHLMGIKLVMYRSCEDQRLHKAMTNATYAMMATGAARSLHLDRKSVV